MRKRTTGDGQLLLAVILAAGVARTGLGVEDCLAIGRPRAQVLEIYGPPEREVNTDRGTVMFYGGLLLDINGGKISYVTISPGGRMPVPLRARGLSRPPAERETPAPAAERSGSPPVGGGGGGGGGGGDGGLEDPLAEMGMWRVFALQRNEANFVARLRRVVFADSYRALFTYDKHAKTHEERSTLSCHDVRDRRGNQVKCYGQDLDIRESSPTLNDLKPVSIVADGSQRGRR